MRQTIGIAPRTAAAMRAQSTRFNTLSRRVRATEDEEIREAAQSILDEALDCILGTLHCPDRYREAWVDAANEALDRVEAALA